MSPDGDDGDNALGYVNVGISLNNRLSCVSLDLLLQCLYMT